MTLFSFLFSLYEKLITKKPPHKEMALVLVDYTKRWRCAALLAGLRLASYGESQKNLIKLARTGITQLAQELQKQELQNQM